jgi:hypothetical protein
MELKQMKELELRDYFAAMALQALLQRYGLQYAVNHAYEVADLMLAKK